MDKNTYNKYIDDCRMLGKYIFQGFTNAQIAKKMNCSKSTVSNRLNCLFKKYSVSNRLDFCNVVFREIVNKYRTELDESKSNIILLKKELTYLKKILNKIISCKDNPSALEKAIIAAQNILSN